jgi:L-threonylcarbamoyladenylate synthase
MKTHIISAADPKALSQAFETLQQGNLVAFPTDTVYGVGALAHDKKGIHKLFAVKGREASKAIPILIGDPSDLERIAANIGSTPQCLARRFWPGPLTLVVPRHPSLPRDLGPEPTIGVRMPDHPLALALLQLCGPMAVTSANLSGQCNSRTAQEVLAQLGGRIPLILDGGQAPGGLPSTVVDCTAPDLVILRAGPLSLEELQEVLRQDGLL